VTGFEGSHAAEAALIVITLVRAATAAVNLNLDMLNFLPDLAFGF
jgi:hypothetical protein